MSISKHDVFRLRALETIHTNEGSTLYICRAVASLEEAEGHQHLAGGHGGGCEQNSPLPLRWSGSRDPRIFLYIFNTKSYVVTHSLAPKIGTTSVLSRPLCIGGNGDCWKRLPIEARRAENRGRRPKAGRVVGEGAASPTR